MRSVILIAIGALTLAGSSASEPFRRETARPADAFVESIGVDVHLGYYDTANSKLGAVNSR